MLGQKNLIKFFFLNFRIQNGVYIKIDLIIIISSRKKFASSIGFSDRSVPVTSKRFWKVGLLVCLVLCQGQAIYLF
jgi:hypothetical protein